MHIYTHLAHIHMHIYVCIHAYIFRHTFIYTHRYTYICICAYVCGLAYAYVCNWYELITASVCSASPVDLQINEFIELFNSSSLSHIHIYIIFFDWTKLGRVSLHIFNISNLLFLY